LAAEQQQLARLRAESSGDPEAASAARESLQRAANLQLQLLQNESEARQAVNDAAIQAIRDRADEERRASDQAISGIEEEAAALEAQERSLERQEQLLTARANLRRALAELAETSADIEMSRLNEALELSQRLDQEEGGRIERVIQARLRELGIRGDTEDIAQQIAEAEEQQARDRLEALSREQQFERESLQLQQQSNELAAQRAVTEARITELRSQSDAIQAQADLEAAQQIADPAEQQRQVAAAQAQLNAAQQIASLSSQGTTEAEQQLTSTRDINALQQETLDAQQERARLLAEETVSAAEFASELAAAEASTQAIANNLGSLGNLSSLSVAGIQNRRMGGSMKAGSPYLVGDGAGGKITPYSEIVVPGVNSQVLANRKVRDLMTAGLNSPFFDSVASGKVARPSGSSQADLLKEMKALRRDIQHMPTGPTIQGNLNMPQTYALDQSDRQKAKVMADWERDFMRNLKADRGRRF
ncbi:MAG: hypothetical protein AAGA75_15700, partial [Cyanobacteria bacterium P01_E01_bin.6]